MPKRKPARPHYSWRDTPESAIRSLPSWPSPQSLRPGPQTVEAFVSGDVAAIAITLAWTLVIPVRIVDEVIQ